MILYGNDNTGLMHGLMILYGNDNTGLMHGLMKGPMILYRKGI